MTLKEIDRLIREADFAAMTAREIFPQRSWRNTTEGQNL